MERAAARTARTTAIEVAPRHPPPRPWAPPDAETLGVTRRQFLNRSIVNTMLLAVSGFGSATLAFLWPRPSSGFGSKVTLSMSLSDLQAQLERDKAPVYIASGRLYISPYPASALPKARASYPASVVAGMADAGIVALYQKCPHLGCRVPRCQTSQWFECPCHGSQYNRVGEKKGGPAPRGMDRFPVRVEGGRVTVDTALIVQGPPIGTNTTGQEAEGPHCVSAGGE